MDKKGFPLKSFVKTAKNFSIVIISLLMTFCVSGCFNKLIMTKELPQSVTEIETVTSDDGTSSDDKVNSSNTTNSEDTLKVHFIDVGQGDSIFIQQGDNTMLIDAGERDQGTIVTSYLNSLKVYNIDYLVGTHPHSDHIGGMTTVINSISVSSAIIPDVEHDTKTYESFIDALIEKEINTIPAESGKTYSFGNAEFQIIGPVADDYDNLNDWSVVIKLTYGEKSFLFTGDAEKNAENDLLSSKYDLSADVLKIGHHGSTTSTSARFLKKVAPTYAVISCGVDNKYGHPDEIIMNRLKLQEVEVFGTYESGTIIAECDGKTITFQTEK